MEDNIKIGLLIIATNKYLQFIPPLLQGADRFFCKNEEVTYFLFTDHEGEIREGSRPLHRVIVPHKEWPWMTLERYRLFHESRDELKKMDYLFYCDADMLFVGEVGTEILEERVATLHPGCFLWNPRGEPETRPESLAYIGDDEEIPDCYKCGGFNGGSSAEFLKMSETLCENIKKDYENGIIARWHDESHFNRYMLDHPPTKILSPSYCFAENYPLPFEPKLVALEKNKEEVRS